MDTQRASMMAIDCMNYYGLYNQPCWNFSFIRSMSTLGAVRPKTRRLVLSKPYVLHNTEDLVLDTILHEIAHALTYQKIRDSGSRQWHGWIWQQVARQIGAKPETCASAKGIVLPTKWQGTCADCGVIVHRQRQPKPWTLSHAKHLACKYKATKGTLAWTVDGKPYVAPTTGWSTIDTHAVVV